MLVLTKQNTVTGLTITWKVETAQDIKRGLLTTDVLHLPMTQEEAEIFSTICYFCNSYREPCLDYIVTIRPKYSQDKLSSQRSQQ